MKSISKKAITVITDSYLAVDNNGNLVAISFDERYQFTIQVDGLSDREISIKPFQFTPYGLFHYMQDLRPEPKSTNTDNERENFPNSEVATGGYDELSEKDIESYKLFIDSMESDAWGCLGYIALTGIIIYILIKFFV